MNSRAQLGWYPQLFLFCRRSHGGHIAQFHYCIIQREPISLSNAPNPPPPPSPPLLSSLPSYLLYIQREQSSPAAKQGEEKILWTVKAISYKMMYGEMMATVMHRNKHTHAHYSDKVWWETGLDGPTVEIKLLLFISLLDIESLESGQ